MLVVRRRKEEGGEETTWICGLRRSMEEGPDCDLSFTLSIVCLFFLSRKGEGGVESSTEDYVMC